MMRCAFAVAALLSVIAQPLVAYQQLETAQTALQTGRYDDAIAEFNRMVRAQPSSVEATRGLVRALSAVGRYSQAQEIAERYADLNDGSAELSNSLGEVLQLRGDRVWAERAFLHAAATASDSLTARFYLAVLKYERGEVAQAFQEFSRFVGVYNRANRLSSSDLTAVANAVRFLGVRDAEMSRDALRVYDEAIAADPGHLDPRILVGELFLERYAGTDAHAAFNDVLELNPLSPRALLGMARTSLFNGEANAMELADSALGVNSHFVPALVFRATLHLQAEAYDRALEDVERALDVNPTSLDALTVQAAARYLGGDDAGFAESRDRVLALNPNYGALYATLAEVSARNRLYERAARFAEMATELDPLSWRGYALLGMNELRNGRVSEGRRNLELAFAGDPYDVWTKNTLDLLDTLDQYPETGTERFRFFIDGTESDLLTLYLSEIAEEAYEELALKYGFWPPTPIRVEVYTDEVDFSVRTVGIVGLRALGVSFGPVIAMISPSAKEEGHFNWGSTFWHELAHTFHMGVSESRVPRWFTEGLSVLEERRAKPGWGDDVNPGFLIAYLQGQLHDVGALNNGFTRPSYPEQLGYSYYQASLVCELIEREYGFAALVEFLRGYANGRSSAELSMAVLNVDLHELNDRFDRFMRERFAEPIAALSAQIEADSTGRRSMERMLDRSRADENDYVAQLSVGRMLFADGDLAGALPFLERAKSLFPEYAGELGPHMYLAAIYSDRGENARAISELRAMTRIDERSYLARLELFDLLQSEGDSLGAAAVVEELLYIHPMDKELHVRLAELSSASGRWHEAIRERRAVLALSPVDRSEALYQLAKAYFDSGDLENARRSVIEALEGAPNYQRAQELLLEIFDRRGQTRE